MQSPDPIALEELLAGYVLEDLTLEEKIQVEELLAQNPDLIKEVQQLRSIFNLLPLGLSPADVPPPLLLSRSPANQSSTSIIQTTRKFPWRKVALGSLLTMAIAALGWQNHQLHEQLAHREQENQQLQQLFSSQTDLANYQYPAQKFLKYRQVVNLLQEPNKNFLTLRAIKGKSQATGSLIVGAESASALLVLKDVPSPSDGKVYQLWAVINGKKIACRSFQPNDQGEVLLEIPVEKWFSASEVMITEENRGQMLKPQGEMVIEGYQVPFQS
ncbi:MULTISPECIES: anti-sigma factor domain-containing protein [unclassified Synechocystis]|uniref:anti-sigma factor domain-containing protein n=1 Tax=unclassified Synechocystis TaxID=2640012 RepID=UPI0004120A08|nr:MULTISPECIES: anti-sigma factor [unclassified Synechocystis]AIE75207.1 hypothetical protein D082_26790 [Synechocystis sp. PCC 6714]MCT0252960.1 anti-sigma factor [Synechocystis sp. CS-94]